MEKYFLAALFVLINLFGVAHADLSGVTGEFKVTNHHDCFGDELQNTGRGVGTPVSIVAEGSKLTMSIKGSNPLTLTMFEGSTSTPVGTEGDQLKRDGVSFGNGFAYTEEERNAAGTRIVSEVNYGFSWQEGELQIKKTIRISANHSEVVWCDLSKIVN